MHCNKIVCHIRHNQQSGLDVQPMAPWFHSTLFLSVFPPGGKLFLSAQSAFPFHHPVLTHYFLIVSPNLVIRVMVIYWRARQLTSISIYLICTNYKEQQIAQSKQQEQQQQRELTNYDVSC